MNWILILTLFANTSTAAIKDPVYDDHEGLDLIHALIRDRQLDAAETELKGLPEVPDTRGARAMATGDLLMARERFEEAARAYLLAPVSEERDSRIARAYARAGKWRESAAAFRLTSEKFLDQEGDAILAATALYRAGDPAGALERLDRAFKRGPGYPIARERVALLLELGLVREALNEAFRFTATSPAEWIGFAELFRDRVLRTEALMLLEWARLHDPTDVDVNLSLAKLHFEKGDLRSAAEAFERAAARDSKFHFHAAEIRRQLGDRQTAQYRSLLVNDEKDRLKSRLALLVDASAYPLIASMDAVIAASPLSADDETRYALGYSLLRLGTPDRPFKYLNPIVRADLMERTARLKKAWADCRAGIGTCRL